MIPRQIKYFLVSGDEAPDLRVRFLGLDLADYDSITMKIRLSTGALLEKEVTPDLDDPELGLVTWDPGDLLTGSHEAEFELISDLKPLTLPRRKPVILEIRRALD